MPDNSTQLPVTDLHSTVAGADKVYHIAIVPSFSGFIVPFAYGRRGSTLTRGTKTKAGPVSLEEAMKIHTRELAGKLREGYQYAPGISGNVFGTPTAAGVIEGITAPPAKEDSGYQPQLLRPATEEEAEVYIKNPDYCAQEKLDGKRLMYRKKGNKIIGINKKGMVVPISPNAAASVAKLEGDILIDTETIGEEIYIFGLREYKGVDYTIRPYGEVLDALADLQAEAPEDDNLILIYTAILEEEKRGLFNWLKESKKEGIVFKSLSTSFRASRTVAQVKCKFYETASFVVDSVNDKASVKLGLYKEDGTYFTVGNVTIPPNYSMPVTGNVIEVKYLYAYKGGSVYLPIYLGERDDVDPRECLESQLKYTGKNGEDNG